MYVHVKQHPARLQTSKYTMSTMSWTVLQKGCYGTVESDWTQEQKEKRNPTPEAPAVVPASFALTCKPVSSSVELRNQNLPFPPHGQCDDIIYDKSVVKQESAGQGQ